MIKQTILFDRDYNRAALPAILDFLEQEGYEAVTLSELLTPVEVE